MDLYQELINTKANEIQLGVALKGLIDALPEGIEQVEGLSWNHSCILGGAIKYAQEVLEKTRKES